MTMSDALQATVDLAAAAARVQAVGFLIQQHSQDPIETWGQPLFALLFQLRRDLDILEHWRIP